MVMQRQQTQAIASRTVNLVIGGLALMLGPVLMLIGSFIPSDDGSTMFPTSISAYYSYNFVTKNIFVGWMSAVGILMLCYRGWSARSNAIDRMIGVAGCVSSLAIANLPCCEPLPIWYKWGHGIGAMALFGLLAAMLLFRFTDATNDADEERFKHWKTLRNLVYRICGVGIMVTSIGSAALAALQKQAGLTPYSHALLAVEAVCLTFFGIGWLTKSRYLLGYKRDGWTSFAYRRESLEKHIKSLPGFKEATARRLQKSGTGLSSGPDPDDVTPVAS